MKKDEKTDDWVESVAVSQKKSGAEIRETAVNNASNATALLTKATYHSHPSSSPSSSSSNRKRANLASSKSSPAQKAGKAAKKAAGRSGSRAPAAGSKKKERSRETTRADSDSDDDLVVTKVTKAPKVDQEKVYNAFMKENSLVVVPDAPYVSGHCYFNAVDYSRQHLLQPAVAQTAPARQLRRLVSLVQRSAAYLEILTVEEALPRDKPRGGRVSVFGFERREKREEREREEREGEGEKRGKEIFFFFRLGFLVAAGALTNFHVQSTFSKF